MNATNPADWLRSATSCRQMATKSFSRPAPTVPLTTRRSMPSRTPGDSKRRYPRLSGGGPNRGVSGALQSPADSAPACRRVRWRGDRWASGAGGQRKCVREPSKVVPVSVPRATLATLPVVRGIHASRYFQRPPPGAGSVHDRGEVGICIRATNRALSLPLATTGPVCAWPSSRSDTTAGDNQAR